MERLTLTKTFNSTLKGTPGPEVVRLAKPQTVALLPSKIPFIKPGLLVHEGDEVAIGAPLFQDKRDPRIKFLSPGGGVVEKILFGSRRVIEEIVIRLASDEEVDPYVKNSHLIGDRLLSGDSAESLSRQEITELLLKAGMWQMLRQFPFMDIADDKLPIPMIIVSLQQGDLFSPSASVVLKGKEDYFLCGLSIIKKLSEMVVVAAPQSFISSTDGQIKGLKIVAKEITHLTSDLYPAGDPGVILYKIRKSSSQNRSVTIHLQDLIAVGELLSTGNFPLERIYTITGTLDRKASHLISRQGSPVNHLTGDIASGRGVITGGLFTGSIALSSPGSTTSLPSSCSHMGRHMGRDDYSAIVMKQSSKEQLFGFLDPGFATVTESRTFISSFIRSLGGGLSSDVSLSTEDSSDNFSRSDRLPNGLGLSTDMNMHGEERPCINCGLCDKKCPVDLLPQFIMKAIQSEEVEEVIEMGILDCTLCGLCTFVCPSKIDLTNRINSEKKRYYEERVTE